MAKRRLTARPPDWPAPPLRIVRNGQPVASGSLSEAMQQGQAERGAAKAARRAAQAAAGGPPPATAAKPRVAKPAPKTKVCSRCKNAKLERKFPTPRSRVCSKCSGIQKRRRGGSSVWTVSGGLPTLGKRR